MANGIQSAMGQLHRLIGPGSAAALTDSQLLADFTARRDEKAFEVLVWRYSGLVLGMVRFKDNSKDEAAEAMFLKPGADGRR